jgi:rubrerythrin
MDIDEGRLGLLIEESDDLHADAMRAVEEPLDDMVEAHHERTARGGVDPDEIAEFNARRASGLHISPAGGLAAAGLGTAMYALMQSPAWAQASPDLQMLQTAASIENLAVAAYTTALTLDFIGGSSAIPVVKAFVMKTKDQHQEHADAFNAAAKNMNGQEQKNPDPVLLDVVNKAKPGLTGPGPVVDLAIELENTAGETYVANTSAYRDANAKKLAASIMGVEAQHASILYAVKALIEGGAPELIALPPDVAKLPAAAGSVGFPDAFFKTTDARPADEGAVR